MTTETYWTVGGRGGTTARLSDLEHAVSALQRARSLVMEAVDHATAQEHVLYNSEHAVTEATRNVFYEAHRSVHFINQGWSGAPAVADDIDSVAVRLDQLTVTLIDAEFQARGGLSAVERARFAFRDWAATGVWVSRAVVGIAVGASGGLLLRLPGGGRASRAIMPDGPPPTTGLINGDVVEPALGVLRMTPAATRVVGGPASMFEVLSHQLALLTATLQAWFRNERWVAMGREIGTPPLAAPNGLGDVMDNLELTRETDPYSIGIQTITQADGTTAYVVYIPGTESFNPGDPTWLGLHSNTTLMNERTSESMLMALEAMDRAGIPPDAPVMLAGHSQGGMVATALASSPTVAARFSITHVVTAGSPTGHYPRPEHVQFMHLEQPPDLTPALDGLPNPDLPNVTTAVSDPRTSSDPARADAGRFLVDAHETPGYADMARLLDADPNSSVTGFMDSANGFFEGSTGTFYERWLPLAEDPADAIQSVAAH